VFLKTFEWLWAVLVDLVNISRKNKKTLEWQTSSWKEDWDNTVRIAKDKKRVLSIQIESTRDRFTINGANKKTKTWTFKSIFKWQ